MGDDLLTMLREHDLPPKWDGYAVLWDHWHAPGPMFICPPPKAECCEGCGSMVKPVLNKGLVALRRSTTHDDMRADGENRERLKSLAHKRPSIALWRLYAFRCPDCRLDTVWDHDTNEWWTLDHTDYGDEGSS